MQHELCVSAVVRVASGLSCVVRDLCCHDLLPGSCRRSARLAGTIAVGGCGAFLIGLIRFVKAVWANLSLNLEKFLPTSLHGSQEKGRLRETMHAEHESRIGKESMSGLLIRPVFALNSARPLAGQPCKGVLDDDTKC